MTKKKKSSCHQSHTKLWLCASVTVLVKWMGEGRTPRYFHIISGGPALLCSSGLLAKRKKGVCPTMSLKTPRKPWSWKLCDTPASSHTGSMEDKEVYREVSSEAVSYLQTSHLNLVDRGKWDRKQHMSYLSVMKKAGISKRK